MNRLVFQTCLKFAASLFKGSYWLAVIPTRCLRCLSSRNVFNAKKMRFTLSHLCHQAIHLHRNRGNFLFSKHFSAAWTMEANRKHEMHAAKYFDFPAKSLGWSELQSSRGKSKNGFMMIVIVSLSMYSMCIYIYICMFKTCKKDVESSTSQGWDKLACMACSEKSSYRQYYGLSYSFDIM